MKIWASLIATILLINSPAIAAVDPSSLERVSRTYADSQPELKTYQVTLETDKTADMIARMTSNMPPDLPRPSAPTLRKYASRASDLALVRAEGPEVFPYMQELVERVSRELIVELRTLFLPPRGAARRQELLKQARVRTSESRLGDTRTQTIEIRFKTPVDLQGAFYEQGLELPQSDVKALTFDLDPDLNILKNLEIATSPGLPLLVELRHLPIDGGYLPREIRITTPNGQIDDHFVTTFQEIGGFWLPEQQTRTIRRAEHTETITVTFVKYKINKPLPIDISAPLKSP